MAYLDDNPPRHQQFRCPRRKRPSGIIGVHTAESFPDETGPDTGAENVARFIRDRTSYGSYHLLADSDSIIQLVEFRCVAYHIGTHGLNEHTIGISAATQAAKWNSIDDDYADAMVRNMARAAARAARWLEEHYGITVPSRRITLAQALRGERGFLAHGDADPDRRTDPGSTFPWGDFLGYYADEMNGDDDDMFTDEDRGQLRELYKQLGRPISSVDGSAWTLAYALQRIWHRLHGDVHMNTRRLKGDLAAIQTMVSGHIADSAGLDREQLLADVQASVEDGVAAGVAAEIPAVVAAVLDALGDAAADLTQDAVVEAVKQALREGVADAPDA